MEAAGLGVPSVAMSVPGLQDSIRPGSTGWLCEAEGSLALVIARALETLREPVEAGVVPSLPGVGGPLPLGAGG